MTEKELRQKVVDTAKAWHGRRESNGGHKEIIDLYNTLRPLPRLYPVKYTDEWCATYVSAVGVKLGLTDIMFPECGCPSMITLYKNAGRWVEDDAYVPAPGDLVQYDWQDNGKGDNKGTPDHIGIVCSVSGSTMQIIEGNISNSVDYRTLKVNARYIRGYCCPDYASKADTMEPEAPAAPAAPVVYTVQASGDFEGLDAAEAALAKVKALGFSGSVVKKAEAPAETVKAVKKGDTVRIKNGATYYTGQKPASFVYTRDLKVKQVDGDRVVVTNKGVVIGAVHKDNLVLVD